MPTGFSNDHFFREIGRISVLFATLDFYASEILVGLKPGLPPPFKDTDTLGRKLGILDDLSPADTAAPATLSNLKPHLSSAKTLASERNRYIHDLWIFNPVLVAEGRIGRYRPIYANPPTSTRKELDLGELQAFAKQLIESQKPFEEAVHALRPGFLNTPKA